jgi:hypothetical protein
MLRRTICGSSPYPSWGGTRAPAIRVLLSSMQLHKDRTAKWLPRQLAAHCSLSRICYGERSAAHSASLAGKFIFDISSSRDADSVNLAIQIGKTLKDAGWDWQPRSTLDAIGGPDIPLMGSFFGRNVAVGSCASKWDTFLPAANAIFNPLTQMGIPVSGDKEDDADDVKKGFPCDRLHVFVGSKH